MRFQDRDGAILSVIHEYGGVLARRHLKRMFWSNATLRAMQKRLSKLVKNDYLARPDINHNPNKSTIKSPARQASRKFLALK